MAFLDASGEWYLKQDGTLFYIPREGETIENTTAIVPIIDQLMIIKGKENHQVENIYFENILLQHTRYVMKFKGDEPGQAAVNMNATVMFDQARNIQFNNCEITHTGTSAIWFRGSCSESKVEHCYLQDLGVAELK